MTTATAIDTRTDTGEDARACDIVGSLTTATAALRARRLTTVIGSRRGPDDSRLALEEIGPFGGRPRPMAAIAFRVDTPAEWRVLNAASSRLRAGKGGARRFGTWARYVDTLELARQLARELGWILTADEEALIGSLARMQ